ncbi:MAG: hypothetical protein KAT04_05820 [Methylococcales bacterium]|nr:hypothetical protein [Methylococcales bacterium]
MTENSILIHAHDAVPDTHYPAINCTIPSSSFICIKSRQLIELDIYLQMLAKQHLPISGTIDYKDSLAIAYVDEKIQLISSLSGINNLQLAAEYHQFGNPEQISKRAQELLFRFNCLPVGKKLPAFMTNLEKLSLLIARALMLEPDVLFIGKPFQGLNMQEHDILGDHLISLVTDMNITVVSSDTTMAFTKKAAQQIIYCDDNAFYSYNHWNSFKKDLDRLFKSS